MKERWKLELVSVDHRSLLCVGVFPHVARIVSAPQQSCFKDLGGLDAENLSNEIQNEQWGFQQLLCCPLSQAPAERQWEGAGLTSALNSLTVSESLRARKSVFKVV